MHKTCDNYLIDNLLQVLIKEKLEIISQAHKTGFQTIQDNRFKGDC